MNRLANCRLYWSSRSPFSRKVMVVAYETGVADQIQTVRVETGAVHLNPQVMALNPLNRIPTLEFDDGRILFDSRLICEFLDTFNTVSRLLPSSGWERWEVLKREVLGDGVMENAVMRMRERGRPPALQSQPHAAACLAKINATLDALERLYAEAGDRPFDLGDVGVGCALSYLDFRFPDDGWRNERPMLAKWHESFSSRPSASQTEHGDVR